MAKDLLRLRTIYERTEGRCHVCHSKLNFNNHGMQGTRGAWHFEHSKARANGGSDHGNNLFPACIGCNLDKGILTSRTARKYYGNTRAPYSKAMAGAIVGGLIGAVGGPLGFFIGAAIGAIIGDETSPGI